MNKRYKITCQNCGKQAQRGSASAKYCSKVCNQRAYEKRKGLKPPSFLNNKNDKQIGLTKRQVPSVLNIPRQVVNYGNGEMNFAQEKIQNLKFKKQDLFIKFNSIVNKNQGVINLIKVLATIGGAAMGSKISNIKDGENKTSLMMVGAIVFYFIGSALGKQLIGALSENEIKKLEELKLNIKIIDEEIAAQELLILGVKTELNKLDKKEKYTSITSDKIKDIDFETVNIDGKYNTLLGNVERGFKMIIYGKPGSGKSTLSLDLANDLKNIGKVLYVSAEEGISQTTKLKLNSLNISSSYIKIVAQNSINGIKSEIEKDTSFIIIDSIQRVKNLTSNELKNLYNKYPHISFISISQATKNGDAKGEAEFLHDTDINIRVENFTATNDKNRFGGTGSVTLELPKYISRGRVRRIRKSG